MSADDPVLPPAMPDSPLYARFARRLKAIFVDWLLMMVLIFGALALASSLSSPVVSRVLGFVVVAILLLYEPVLVAFTGGTLGHRWANLRVVNEQHGGNVSFAKACARVVIKGVLGWYSFALMAATRRNQAMHDLLTRSTVRIRDATQASPAHYITERTELAAADMPSRVRRAGAILVYLVLWFAVLAAVEFGLIATGLLSSACLDGRRVCSPGERGLTVALGVVILAVAVACIVQGWRGKLFGARRRATAPA